jgi:hypothetical protein
MAKEKVFPSAVWADEARTAPWALRAPASELRAIGLLSLKTTSETGASSGISRGEAQCGLDKNIRGG